MEKLHISQWFAVLILTTTSAISAAAQDQSKQAKAPPSPGLTLTTPAFTDGSEVPVRFSGAASNPVSPKLEWTYVPEGTVTFVLLMHDPEGAPQKKVEDPLHWLAFNIPGSARELPEGVGYSN